MGLPRFALVCRVRDGINVFFDFEKFHRHDDTAVISEVEVIIIG